MARRFALARRLTPRQSHLLDLMARGYSLADAAVALDVSMRRASDDLAGVCRRLNARDHADALALWVGADLVPRV